MNNWSSLVVPSNNTTTANRGYSSSASRRINNTTATTRAFSTTPPTTPEGEESKETITEVEAPVELTEVEQLTQKVEQLEKDKKEMKDQLLRSLAEQENIRKIARRDVSNATQFSTQKMAKSLLDISDNLERAIGAVTDESKASNTELNTFYEGVSMTNDLLLKSFSANKLEKFGAIGDVFNPELHDALFAYEDETKEAGTIGQVMKTGFTLNERVIRAAQVGTVKK